MESNLNESKFGDLNKTSLKELWYQAVVLALLVFKTKEVEINLSTNLPCNVSSLD